MICYLKHNEIDLAQWDALMGVCGNCYACSWYLDIVHPGWEALVEMKDCNYISVMPLTGNRKWGVSYLFQPFFVQQLGVFSCQELSKEKCADFLRSIPARYRFSEIRMNESNTFNYDCKEIGFHRNVILDLSAEYEALRAAYHTNTRRNLAKAESHGLRLVDNVEMDEIIQLFRENRGATVKVWGDMEYDTLRRLAAEAQRRGAAFVCGVCSHDADEVLCGALFMRFRNVVTFLFSGCGQEGRGQQAMTFMMDSVIRRYAGQKLILDFEGSDDDNLARFYLGFGGKTLKYPSYSLNRLPKWGQQLLKCWKKR